MIRNASQNDVEIIVQLIRELADYEGRLHDVKVTPDILRQHLFGEKRYAEVCLAEDQGITVGFALYFHNYSTFAGKPGIYLEDIFVRPNYRRKGLGHQLFRAIAQLAVERGCGFVQWTVLTWNRPAIDFYQALGAICLDEWKVYRLPQDRLKALASIAP